jgi:hypothetical protein
MTEAGMEFFEEVKNNGVDVNRLKALLTIENLPKLCAFISVTDNQTTIGTIYCDWGQQTLSREEVKNGVRFSSLTCPDALTWSVTLQDNGKTVLIHCATNKKQHDEEYIDSILEFMGDWSTGLSKAFHGGAPT